jgi:hypothetical protein
MRVLPKLERRPHDQSPGRQGVEGESEVRFDLRVEAARFDGQAEGQENQLYGWYICEEDLLVEATAVSRDQVPGQRY